MTIARGGEEWLRMVAAARAERDRLELVDSVMSDILDAAITSSQAKGHIGVAAETARRDHWRSVKASVWADHDVASDRVRELEFGPEYAEEVSQRRAKLMAEAEANQMRARGIERSR